MRQESARRRRRAVQVAGVALAAAALLGARAGTAAERAKPAAVGLGIGYRPPEFSSNDLNGAPQSLEAYQGNVVVLHFWASWCPYCRSEIPELTQLHTQWASKGVRVLTISTDQDVGALKRFLAKSPLPYPIVHDPSVADQYAISGVPVTYIVGRDGRIAVRLNGASELIDAVEHVLAAPAV